jgi:DNA primase
VNTKSGWFTDFVTGQSGPLVKLAMITLNINEKDAKNFLRDEYFDSSANAREEEEETKIVQDKFFDSDFVKDLMPWYTFYKNRGISEQTVKDFGGGVKTYGKLNNRFVFPVYQGEKIIGLAGRDLYTNSQRPKWKILGRKANFVYPYKLAISDIESSRCVILVESIGDALSLYEAGIKNFLVLFGLSVSKPVILTLIKSNVDKIIIATNNDIDSETNRGMEAALGIKYKLSKFFSSDSIFVKLPYKKDFGDMKKQEIIEWYKSL